MNLRIYSLSLCLFIISCAPAKMGGLINSNITSSNSKTFTAEYSFNSNSNYRSTELDKKSSSYPSSDRPYCLNVEEDYECSYSTLKSHNFNFYVLKQIKDLELPFIIGIYSQNLKDNFGLIIGLATPYYYLNMFLSVSNQGISLGHELLDGLSLNMVTGFHSKVQENITSPYNDYTNRLGGIRLEPFLATL